MSGLTVLLLVSFLNMFFASELIFKVYDVTVWKKAGVEVVREFE